MAGVISRRAYRFLAKIRKRLFGSRLDKSPLQNVNRFKYTTRPGETIDRIAKICLGDERLAGLIITINRSSIVFDGNGVAVTLPGTPLDLPAMEEVRVYKENYLPSLSKASPRIAKVKPRIAVNQNFLQNIEISPIDKFTVEVKQDPATIVELSEGCRMSISSVNPLQTQFSVKLQAAFFNGYMTIASYESILGQTRRVIFTSDQRSNTIEIDLPADVAVEMAKRDFHRNWKKYYDDYFLTPTTKVMV